MAGGMPFTSIYPSSSTGDAGASSSTPASDATVNTAYPGMPPGAVPIHRDLTVSAKGTAVIYSPPTDRRMVVAGAMVSSDTKMRVAIVDGADVQGSRILDQQVAAGGGSSPNMVPVPWPQASAGTPIRLVTSADGTVSVRISGWLE